MTVPTIRARLVEGEGHRELIVLGPSLGTSVSALWSSTAVILGQTHDVAFWDLPGHGDSPAGTEFTMAELASGLLAAVDELTDAVGTFAYAGDSAGGAVGLQLLLDSPDRLTHAVLVCTGAKIGEPEAWNDRAAFVRLNGTAQMVEGSAERWFSAGFSDHHREVSENLLQSLRDTDDESYAAVCEALAAFDVRDRLHEISTPVLTIAGAEDIPTPPSGLELIATGVLQGRSVVLDGVAHLAPAERPEIVANLIREHLELGIA